MLWGLQSSVTSRFWSGRVAAWLASGAMSPRVQNPGVHALGLHIFPLSGSTCGGTGVGDGQVWAALAAAGIRIARPSATRNGTRRVLPRILLRLLCGISTFARIDPPSTVRSRSVVACAATSPCLPGPNAVACAAGYKEGEPRYCALPGIGQSSSAHGPKRISDLLARLASPRSLHPLEPRRVGRRKPLVR